MLFRSALHGAEVVAEFDARTDKHLLRISRRHHGNVKSSVVTADFVHGADYAALALALLIEQAWPLRRGNRLYAGFEQYADFLERKFNGLQESHGAIAWCVAVLPLALVTVVVYWLLRHSSTLLAIAWSVAVLYVAMGFRRFSHCFTEIAQALREQIFNRRYVAAQRHQLQRGQSGKEQ